MNLIVLYMVGSSVIKELKLAQATSTLYCKNRVNCDKSMKFGPDVPYIKTIKKGGRQSKHSRAKKPPWGSS